LSATAAVDVESATAAVDVESATAAVDVESATAAVDVESKWCETSNKELLNSLRPIERLLMKRMDLVQVPGKRNRRVPILITPEIGRAMQLLVNTRAVCGIPPQNKYFFASDSADGHLDSWLVLHNSAVDAGVSQPRLITSRCLRKYVATLAQVLLICTECGIAVVGCFFVHSCLYVHFYRTTHYACNA